MTNPAEYLSCNQSPYEDPNQDWLHVCFLLSSVHFLVSVYILLDMGIVYLRDCYAK